MRGVACLYSDISLLGSFVAVHESRILVTTNVIPLGNTDGRIKSKFPFLPGIPG